MSGVDAQAIRMMQLGVAPILPKAVRIRLSRGLGVLTSLSVQRRLSRLARGTEPIVAGPWLGEVGFELLYWIPFLSWFASRFDVSPERIVVLSRGGTRDWYSHLASQYYDAFDQIGPGEFRARNAERSVELGEQKQIGVTSFDRTLLEPVLSNVGVDFERVLHPSTMFRVFRPYWWGHMDSQWVRQHARFRRLTSPAEHDVLTRLPQDYTAVKFYYNESFPATEQNRGFARDVLRALRASGPVVSLSTGLALDDHAGWEEEETLAAHGIRTDLSPATNLALQSMIVGHARAWVGTYGGFAYLAPFHGVPATAYYSVESGFSKRHLTLAREVFDQLSASPLLTVREAGQV